MNAVTAACPEADVSVQKELLLECSDLLSEMKRALAGLADVTAKAAAVQGTKECAYAYHDLVVPAMERSDARRTDWRCWWTRSCGPCPATAI